jgi:transketolase C-terminal domain/subunit
MRNKFGQWICDAADKNDKIVLLSGDIGYGIFDDFLKRHPNKFLNCGIAEQNMIGVAAGLAASGYRPIVYTIIPFLIYRPYEFIRNLIAYQNLPVILVGVGGGYSYDALGFTHYGLEDINLIKNLPNITVEMPYDPRTTALCAERALESNGPTYLRLMKGGEPDVEIVRGVQTHGALETITRFGDDFTICTHSGLVINAKKAVDILAENHDVFGGVLAATSTSELRFNDELKGDIFVYEENQYPGVFFQDITLAKALNNSSRIRYVGKVGDEFNFRDEILKKNLIDTVSMVDDILSIIKK